MYMHMYMYMYMCMYTMNMYMYMYIIYSFVYQTSLFKLQSPEELARQPSVDKRTISYTKIKVTARDIHVRLTSASLTANFLC